MKIYIAKMPLPTPTEDYEWQQVYTILQYSSEEYALYEVNSRRTITAAATARVGLGLNYYLRDMDGGAAQQFSVQHVDELPEITDADPESVYILYDTQEVYRLVHEGETVMCSIDASNPFPSTEVACGSTITMTDNRAVGIWPEDDAQAFFEVDELTSPVTAPSTPGNFTVQLYYTDDEGGVQSPLCKIELTAV